MLDERLIMADLKKLNKRIDDNLFKIDEEKLHELKMDFNKCLIKIDDFSKEVNKLESIVLCKETYETIVSLVDERNMLLKEIVEDVKKIEKDFGVLIKSINKEEISELMKIDYFFSQAKGKGNAKISFFVNKVLNKLNYFSEELYNEHFKGYLECIKEISASIDETLDDCITKYNKLFDEEEEEVKPKGKKQNNLKISTHKELLSIAKDNGFIVDRYHGSHTIVKNNNGEVSVIPHKSSNRNIGKGLTKKILKDIDI